MPFEARIDSPDGTIVDARKLTREESHHNFYCKTSHCNANMILVNAGNPERAYFRSLKRSEHISSHCIKSSIVFDKSKYDEKQFSLSSAFASILGISHAPTLVNRVGTGTRNGNVGGSRNNRIHTLGVLYAACRTIGKAGNYNGYIIDDILADDENYVRYSQGIQGYKLVETSYYYKVRGKLELIMNCPADNMGKNSWVKLRFINKRLFWECYSKLKDFSHVEPVIIAGYWDTLNSPNAHSGCIIYSSNQIYWPSDLISP